MDGIHNILQLQQQQQQLQQQQQQLGVYEGCGRRSSSTAGGGGDAAAAAAAYRCCCCCCGCSNGNSSSSSSKQRQQEEEHLSLDAAVLRSKVVLNVGGRLYTTTLSTLCNYGPHYFSRRLSPPWRHGETREIFIDRNGDTFSYVLDYLRNGTLCCSNKPWLLQMLLQEARFFCIRSLEAEIERRLKEIRAQGVASRCAEADM